MKFAQIRKYDTANGPGIRTSVFFTGCTHACIGCFNELYQDFEYGQVWGEKQTNLIISFLNDPKIKGLTLLGGEPLQQPFEEMYDILTTIRANIPEDKTIWMYTGYRWDEILEDEHRKAITQLIDVVIDGRFEYKLKNLRLRFRGSSNQKIINVKKSLQSNQVIIEMD